MNNFVFNYSENKVAPHKIYPTCTTFAPHGKTSDDCDQLHWTKDKGTQILTCNDAKNGLMMSYLPLGDDISKLSWILRDFVSEYHYARFGCDWTTNKGETEGRNFLLLKQSNHLCIYSID